MSNMAEIQDCMAFHPGYYVADIIEDMQISQAEFAVRMGTTTKTISCLVNGQINLSNDLAKKLSVMTGTSVDVWLNLQKAYDKKMIEVQQLQEFQEQVKLADYLDYKYFVRNAGLPDTDSKTERVANLCKWLKVANLKNMIEVDYCVGNVIIQAEKINSKAWVQSAINISYADQVKKFSLQRLNAYMKYFRAMTIQKPENFLPEIRNMLAESGVKYVLLPSLKNSNVNSVVKWMSKDNALLAMNSDKNTVDCFWVSFFSNIKLIQQKKIKRVFINGRETDMCEENEQLQQEVRNFADNCLIAPSEWDKFSPTKNTSDTEIVNFAKSIQIHPGIVAGRMNRDRLLSKKRYLYLNECYDEKKMLFF